MKQLQNNFTTPEQSKRLLELGLSADSADCYWHFIHRSKNAVLRTELRWLEPPYLNKYTAFVDMAVGTDKYRENRLKTYLPCWSVGRLIEIWLHICDDGFEVHSPCYLPEVLVDAFEDYDRDTFAEYGHHIDFSKLEE